MGTYGSRPKSCRFCIHHEAVEHHSFLVPGRPSILVRGMSDENTHEFDSNLLIIEKICPLENNAKGSLSYFLANAVMNTNNIRGGGRHYPDAEQMRPNNVSS